jgi:DNA polymerase-3 subunit delta'
LAEWELQLAGGKKSIITAEEANNIVKSLSLKSFSRGYKFMVIWMPEKLNIAASNKLLKTLEEPTDRTIIILVCNSTEGLLTTILSRVQEVKCHAPGEDEIAEALAVRDGVAPGEARNFAARAEGSYSKARRLMGEDAERSANLDMFVGWMRHCFKVSFTEIFKLADAFAKLGKDGQQQFIDYALEYIHGSVLYEFAGRDQALFDAKEAAFAAKFAPYITAGDISRLHDVLSEGHYLVERNANANLLFTNMSLELTRYFAARKARHNA